jgi:hypothetical protein
MGVRRRENFSITKKSRKTLRKPDKSSSVRNRRSTLAKAEAKSEGIYEEKRLKIAKVIFIFFESSEFHRIIA